MATPDIGQNSGREHWNTWKFWQYAAERTDVRGVTGRADLDKFNGSSAELDSFVIRDVGLSLTKKALGWLRTSQKADGSWSESTGITALVLLSFFNAGISPDDPTDTDGDGIPDLQEGIAYLTKHFDAETGYFYGKIDVRGNDPCYSYDTSLCILALIAADRASGRNHYTRSHFKSLPRQIMIQAMVKNPSYTTSDLSYRTNNLR